MASNRELELQSREELEKAFGPTIDSLEAALGSRAFRPRRSLNAAVFEAVMVGLANRLATDEPIEPEEIVARYDALVAEPDFLASTEVRTSDEPSVATRLVLGTQAFAND